MDIPMPKTWKQYPKYILGYWLALWAAMVLYSVFQLITNITPSGKFVEKRDCLEYDTAGRFDESQQCVEYSEPYFEPAGTSLKNDVINTGRNTGLLVLAVGGFLMYSQRKLEISEQK